MSDFFKDIDLKTEIEADRSAKDSQKREESVAVQALEPEPQAEPEVDRGETEASESFFAPGGETSLRSGPELVIQPPSKGAKSTLSVQAKPAPAAVPPPIPSRGASPPPVTTPAAAAPPSPAGITPAVAVTPDVLKQYMPKAVPRERDIGALGATLIWFFTSLIFGGSMVVWVLALHLVESGLNAASETIDVSRYQNFFTAMAGDPDSAEDVRDVEALQMEALQGGILRKDWPDVRLTGVIEGTDTHDARVILDGVLTQVGGSVQGIKVVEVRNNGAVLEYKGEQQWLFSSQRAVRTTEQ